MSLLISERDLPAWKAYRNNEGISVTHEDFAEAYAGEWDTEKDFARSLFEDMGYLQEIPDHMQGYIDYASFASDLFMGDYYSLPNPCGGIFVYHNF